MDLFVNKKFDSNEDDLKNAFVDFRGILRVKIVRDLKGKSRGYGFVEFEAEDDMIRAYQNCPEIEVQGKVCKTDAIYAGLRKSFRPMRLGGGLGSSRSTIVHPFKKLAKKRVPSV